MPWASYQWSSAKRILPAERRIRAIPFIFRQLPGPYVFRKRWSSRIPDPFETVSICSISPTISKCITDCISLFGLHQGWAATMQENLYIAQSVLSIRDFLRALIHWNEFWGQASAGRCFGQSWDAHFLEGRGFTIWWKEAERWSLNAESLLRWWLRQRPGLSPRNGKSGDLLRLTLANQFFKGGSSVHW